jgi:hypothetical protein
MNYLSLSVARSLNGAKLDLLHQEALAHAQEVGLRKAAGRAKLSTWGFAIVFALQVEADNSNVIEAADGAATITTDFLACKQAIQAHVDELTPIVRSEIVTGLAEKAGYEKPFPSKKGKDGNTITSIDALVSAALRNIKAYYAVFAKAWDAGILVDNGVRDERGEPVPDSKAKLSARTAKAQADAISATPKMVATKALGQFVSNAQAAVADFSAEDGERAQEVEAFAVAMNRAFIQYVAGRLSLDAITEAVNAMLPVAGDAEEALADIPPDDANKLRDELKAAVGV